MNKINKVLLSIWILTILSTCINLLLIPLPAILDRFMILNPDTPSVEKAQGYLSSLFNEDLGLLCENKEDAGLDQKYWIYSDNYLAVLAIWDCDETFRDQLNASFVHYQTKYNITTSYFEECLMGSNIPNVVRTSEQTLLENGSDYEIWVDRKTGNIMLDWEEYGDLLLYRALYYYYMESDFGKAGEYYDKAYNMFDGKGIYDKDTDEKKNGTRYYVNYKLAFLIYVSIVLDENLDEIPPMITQLWSMQNETSGGIIARAYMDGTPAGSANCETTAWTLIACEIADGIEK